MKKAFDTFLRYWRLFDPTFFLFLVAIPQLAWLLMTFLDLDGYYEYSAYEAWPDWSCVLTMIFCFYSLVRRRTVFQTALREEYWKKSPSSLKENLHFLLTQKFFWIRVAIFLGIYCFLPLEWTFKSYADLVGDNLTVARLILCTVVAAVAVLAHLSAYRYWFFVRDREKYNKKFQKAGGEAVPLIYTVGAVIVAVAVPNIIVFAKLLYDALSFGIVFIVAVLLLLPPACLAFRAWRKRKSFIKRLKKLCLSAGIAFPKIQRPYRSLFRMREGEDFRISCGKKEYSCKFVSGLRRSVPIVIYRHGDIAFLHRIRLRGATLAEWEVRHSCAYETECQKILIVNPTPKKLYTLQEPKLVEIDNGFTVGEFKIFTASGFLRALDMDVLHR